MITTKTTKLIAIFGILVLAIAACQTSIDRTTTDNTAANTPIKIGAIFILTGQGANWGRHAKQGAELALQELNTAGGINGRQVTIVHEDNQGDNPAQAVSALQKLMTQDINIVLGPNWSPSGLAVAPIACQNNVLMISPSLGIADFNEQCDFLFNTWPHDATLSTHLGKSLFAQGFKRIAILGSHQVWEETQAIAVKKAFETAGGTVVAFELPAGDQADFKTELLKISQATPDALVVQFAQEHIIAKQMRELGMHVPIFAPLIDQERITGAQGALEGAVSFTSFTPTEDFTKRYASTFGEQPDIGATGAFDAVMLLATAMKTTNTTDPTTLKNHLNSLKEWNGTSGLLTFDGKGGVTHEPKKMVVKGNALVSFS